MASGRQGRPGEEMFMNKPSSEAATPTVEPLRINKRESSTSPNPESSQQNGYRTDTRKPSFPLPPGASSSAAPLPYPVERPAPQSRSSNETYKPYHPPSQRSASPSSDGMSPTLGQGKTSRLAERRGNAPRPLPDSPDPDTGDMDNLFARVPPSLNRTASGDAPSQPPPLNPYPDFHEQYWPAPGSQSSGAGGLAAPQPSTINRLSSSASTATTKATRGSPPPPETPQAGPGNSGPSSDIEARYAAAGIAGTATLTSLQAQGAAAAQRANQYGGGIPPLPGQQQPGRRPWTPTEQPGSQPFGPPTVYQGPSEVSGSQPAIAQPTPARNTSFVPTQNPIEQDFQRMHVSNSPPPAYSSVGQAAPLPEKSGAGRGGGIAAAAAAGTAAALAAQSSAQGQNSGHPAFANDPNRSGASPAPEAGHPVEQVISATPSINAGPASPPPLPEGWIAHLDQNSGQYYYIHLPTQSTQWEFPKGPTPLNVMEVPQSPAGSIYSSQSLASPGLSTFAGKKPLGSPGFASPGFAPGSPAYPESIAGLTSPTAASFSGPPPTAGIDMYKVAPTNGVYFGPYLRYTNMSLERGIWLGSILLVTDGPQPPSIHIHQSTDLSPNRT
jgi:hypothetical protein